MVTGQNATLIKACAESQRLLIKILEENAKRLDPTYSTPPRRTCERNYTLSFLTVISSLTMRDIGSLVHDLGCTICGSPTKSRCAQCHSVSYCGKECQSKDWKTHKPTCRSLAGGKWITVTFHSPREGGRPLWRGFPYEFTRARYGIAETGRRRGQDNQARYREDEDVQTRRWTRTSTRLTQTTGRR